MIMFAILLVTLLVLVMFIVVAVGVGGAMIIIPFGDVIVCVFLIIWIMKKIINKKQ